MKVNPARLQDKNNQCGPKANYPKKVAFTGVNPVIALMDGIDRGGVAASFVIQDALGMAVPRTAAGLTRNQKENKGKKNTAYAKLIAIREALSGPSIFLIPMAILYGVKSKFGRANDVPIAHIRGFSSDMSDFASKNENLAKAMVGKEGGAEAKAFKDAYYKNAMKNLLSASTENHLSGKELDAQVEKFAKLISEIDSAPKRAKYKKSPDQTVKKFGIIDVPKKELVQKSRKMLVSEFVENFTCIRKKYSLNPSNYVFKSWFNTLDKDKNGNLISLDTSVTNFMNHLRDYTNDATKSIAKKFNAEKQGIGEFINEFGTKRVGSRFLTNAGMTLVVVSFFTIIPKLYNGKNKTNPALAGLEPTPVATTQAENKEVK